MKRVISGIGSRIVATALLLAAGTAQALPVDVQGFHPSPFMHDMVTVETGDTAGETPWAAGLFVNYQKNPLVLFRVVGDEKTELANILAHQVTANVLASWSPVDWFAIGIDVPVVLFQSGDGFTGGSEPSVASMGDIRLYPRFRLLHTDVVSLALTATLSAPTGHLVDDYTGRSTVGFYPGILLSARAGVFDLAFDLAATVTGDDSIGDAELSHSLQGRLGMRVRAVEGLLDVIGEIGTSMQIKDPFAAINESPAEALGALRFHVGKGVDLTAGGGAGITGGAGAPDLRVFAGFLVTSPPEPEPVPVPEGPKDSDGDGLLDPDDQCPWDPEDKDGFQDTDGCPDPDNDGDRILDPWVELTGELAKYETIGRGSDQCPMVPEDWDGHEDEDGCPDPDNDLDTFCDPWVAAQGKLADLKDICHGIDQCPDEPETVNGLADDDGCPDSRVRLEEGRIAILEVVHFYFNEARIKEESYPLLDDVTTVLREHPELKLVQVQGHTDERGSKSHNLKLSKARAKAVRDYLIAHGIDGARLTSDGFGASRPIVRKAKTEDEHQQNRRVEFVILQRG